MLIKLTVSEAVAICSNFFEEAHLDMRNLVEIILPIDPEDERLWKLAIKHKETILDLIKKNNGGRIEAIRWVRTNIINFLTEAKKIVDFVKDNS